MPAKKHIVVIGAGFSGLSSAAYLARAGYKVTVLEKNAQPGGRAHTIRKDGFRFELGPSWYMMPDVFEEIGADFEMPAPRVIRLDPSYRVYFSGGRQYDLSTAQKNLELFSQLEPGAGIELERFLAKSKQLYELARSNFLGDSYSKLSKLIQPSKMSALFRFPLFGSYHSKVEDHFQDPRLQQILEFMCVFLGAGAKNVPAMYTLLAHVDMNLGIWYPEGGFEGLVKYYEKLAKKQGAKIRYNQEVTSLEVRDERVSSVRVGKKRIACDAVVGATDYHHVETKLLKQPWQTYTEKYWNKKTLSPSAVLINLGLDTKAPGLTHHNLFFDANWNEHFKAIKTAQITNEPLFYACVPSKTDPKCAPDGGENIFILIPTANVGPSDQQLQELRQNVLIRLSERAQIDVAKHIVSEDLCPTSYFGEMFNAYENNAFGLAHTLRQSALLRPKIKSKKVKNLYYAGQFTNPGTGVPLCLLSGKVVSNLIAEEVV